MIKIDNVATIYFQTQKEAYSQASLVAGLLNRI